MNGYKDATRLARWTKLVLAGFIVVSACAVISDLLQLRMLIGFADGSYSSPSAIHEAAVANDARQRVTGLCRLAAEILCGIMVLTWTYRAGANARGLGAVGMQVSPAWAVGWYFVPVANLIKPYDAMREIWRASADPQGWWRAPAPARLGGWWFFFLVTAILGVVAPWLAGWARDLDTLIDAAGIAAIADAAGIMAALFFRRIVGQVQQMQEARLSAQP
jgi:hypothetical protein